MRERVKAMGREPHQDELEALTWRNWKGGDRVPGYEAMRGWQTMKEMTREIFHTFTKFDVLLTPVLSTPVPKVGFIDPVSNPFCGQCDRLRLTADGQFRNCLFSTTEWDVREVLRGGAPEDDEHLDTRIADLLEECVKSKRRAHGIGSPSFERPARAMYQIGG
jgi:molybdenum cofactor biosynthesis enzyme MoaA